MDSLYDSACGAYIYDEDVLDFLVKYDNNLAGEMQILQPDCRTIINSQFLVAYRSALDTSGAPLSTDLLLGLGYDRIPKCFGLMDTSALHGIGIGAVQTVPGLSLSGKDVLVGFIDTGIDFANPLFRRADGTCRVTAIWDQTQAAYEAGGQNMSMQSEEIDTRPIFGYGREYPQELLNLAIQTEQPYQIVPSRDTDGHGTFLASVAAGNTYLDGDDIFSGVAPESDIIMVKAASARFLPDSRWRSMLFGGRHHTWREIPD